VSELDDILVRITDATRERLAAEPAGPGLERRAWEAAGVRRRGGVRSLLGSLSAPGVRVIAECKRRSPSAGVLRAPFEPVELATAYQAGGAAAISVVTEPQFFSGQPGWLPLVRAAVALPVVQKDFLVSSRQLFEAVLLGADAVLLIARILPGGLLGEMVAVAKELGLEVLLEIHDQHDLARSAGLPARVIGVNARDLRTFTVDLGAAAALAVAVGPGRVAVLESGITGPADVADCVRRGVSRFLVGEHLLRAADPGEAVRELVACG